MKNFNIAGVPKLVFGEGKIAELKEHIQGFGKRVLLVTGGSSLKKSGNYDKIKVVLENYNLFEAVIAGEPSPKVVDEIVFAFLNKNIDVVCAVGGGSVIDAGKAVSAMLKQPKFTTVKDYLEVVGNKKPTGLKIPFIALPTTSGTGSEATKNAVISEPGEDGFKSSLRHDNYIPDIALIDPELLISCPASVTKASGLDALSQLIESYLSTNANLFTDSLSQPAIERMLFSLIPASTERAADIELRSNIAYAAFVSGITLAHAGLGTVHGLAGFIGGIKDIPHGMLCGLLLPHWLEITVECMLDDFKKYEYYLTKIYNLSYTLFEADNVRDMALLFVRHIKTLCNVLELPKLSSFGVTEEELEYFAVKGSNKNNPVSLTKEQKLKILKQAY